MGFWRRGVGDVGGRWQRLRTRGIVVVVRGSGKGVDVTGWKW